MSATPTVTGVQRSGPPGPFDPGRGWRLHPQVAVRPEPFGALLYHFGTRKLSFLKSREILALVESLDAHPDVRTACRATGIDESAQAPYLRALAVLADSNMIVPRTDDTGPGPEDHQEQT